MGGPVFFSYTAVAFLWICTRKRFLVFRFYNHSRCCAWGPTSRKIASFFFCSASTSDFSLDTCACYDLCLSKGAFSARDYISFSPSSGSTDCLASVLSSSSRLVFSSHWACFCGFSYRLNDASLSFPALLGDFCGSNLPGFGCNCNFGTYFTSRTTCDGSSHFFYCVFRRFPYDYSEFCTSLTKGSLLCTQRPRIHGGLFGSNYGSSTFSGAGDYRPSIFSAKASSFQHYYLRPMNCLSARESCTLCGGFCKIERSVFLIARIASWNRNHLFQPPPWRKCCFAFKSLFCKPVLMKVRWSLCLPCMGLFSAKHWLFVISFPSMQRSFSLPLLCSR